MNNEELERYSRSIILEDFGIEAQLNLKKSSVIVFGCGGIASGLVASLASSGVGKITLCDFDKVDLSNLQRQTMFKTKDISKYKANLASKFAKSINPNIKVITCKKQLNDSNFEYYLQTCKQCNIIIDTTDNFGTRKLINQISIKTRVPLFSASCIEYNAQFYMLKGYFKNMACYNCIFDGPQDLKTCKNSGVLPPLPIITGSILCGFIIRYLSNPAIFDNFNEFFRFDLKTASIKKTILTKDPKCNICNH
jgi:adenylyltransferase/sulfurtransferase